MESQLGSYVADFQNEVYSRELPPKDGITSRQIMIFERFVEATEDEVVRYLQAKARDLSTAASLVLPGRHAEDNGRSMLEKAVMALPQKVISSIEMGNKELIRFIRSNTSARAVVPGEDLRVYVQARFGILPYKLIDNNRSAGVIDNPDWYGAAFMDDEIQKAGYGEKGKVLVLLYSGLLPKKEEIDLLLSHRVITSRTLKVGFLGPYSEYLLKEVVDTMYCGLTTADEVTSLRDTTTRVLEVKSMEAILSLHQLLKEKMEEAERGSQNLIAVAGRPRRGLPRN